MRSAKGEAGGPDVLVSCLRQDDFTQPSPQLVAITDPEARRRLTADAIRHRVEGVLHLQAQALGWPDEDGGELLRAHHNGVLAGHLHMSGGLHATTKLLEEAQIPSLAFKGPVLADCTYPRPDLRSYGDVDVLIAPSHVRPAVELLRDAGARMYSESWEELRRTERAQLDLVTGRGVPLDLHWHPFNNPGVRAAFRLPAEELLERRRPRTVLGRPVHGLSEADEIIFLAAHAAQSGGALLVWTLDLHLAARDLEDWDQVVRTATAGGLGLVTAIMLARAQHLLDTPVPTDVLDALSSARTWRASLHALDRWRPPQRSRLGTGRVLLRSTRRTTATSLKELMRQTWSEALLPFVRTSQHPWRRALSGSQFTQDHTGFAYRDLRSSRERDEFLTWVEQGSVHHPTTASSA